MNNKTTKSEKCNISIIEFLSCLAFAFSFCLCFCERITRITQIYKSDYTAVIKPHFFRNQNVKYTHELEGFFFFSLAAGA